MKRHKKFFFLLFVIIFCFGLSFYYFPFISNYFQWRGTVKAIKTAKSEGLCPWQFGGIIAYYNPACTLDSVAGDCAADCPQCSNPVGGVGSACSGYQEIDFMSAGGSSDLQKPIAFICVPKAFKYIGGVPVVGDPILGCGSSPSLPIVVGVPDIVGY
jgi:hypothetical protein